MPNYQNGKIYKIWSPSTEEIYIGSTTQSLSRRMAGHRDQHKKKLNGTSRGCTSSKILKYGDARIELVCKSPCDNKEELLAIEGKYIRELDCVNRCVSGRTMKESSKQWREANKEQIKLKKKQYSEANKEQIALRGKQYREANKEQMALKKKQYYEANKEQIALRGKQYREANKDDIKARTSVKTKCECGQLVRKSDLKRHLKTKIHNDIIGGFYKDKIKCECGMYFSSNKSLQRHLKREIHNLRMLH